MNRVRCECSIIKVFTYQSADSTLPHVSPVFKKKHSHFQNNERGFEFFYDNSHNMFWLQRVTNNPSFGSTGAQSCLNLHIFTPWPGSGMKADIGCVFIVPQLHERGFLFHRPSALHKTGFQGGQITPINVLHKLTPLLLLSGGLISSVRGAEVSVWGCRVWRQGCTGQREAARQETEACCNHQETEMTTAA